MANNYDYHSISPVRIDHGSMTDTAIAIYDFDPLTGGYYRDTDGSYVLGDVVDPVFAGELIAYQQRTTEGNVVKMYVAYDSGSGLEWKTVVSNTSQRLTEYDDRTGGRFDSRFESVCMPPWLCE